MSQIDLTIYKSLNPGHPQKSGSKIPTKNVFFSNHALNASAFRGQENRR
jgi:hypothetical protein